MSARRLVLAFPLAALVGVACGDDAPSAPPPAPSPTGQMPGDELSYQLFPSTKELSAGALAAISEVSADGKVVFDVEPAELASVAQGSVLLGGVSPKAPDGLLRFVHTVERKDGKLIVSTVNALPELAFRKLHVKLARTLGTDQAGTPQANEPLSLRFLDVGGTHKSTSLDYFLFNADKNPDTKHDQVHVTGTLGAGFDFFFGLDVDWGEVFELPKKVVECVVSLVTGGGCSLKDLLPEVKVGYAVNADANASLAIEGVAFTGFRRDYTLASLPVTPSTISVGPLVFFLSADVKGVVEGKASSAFSLSTGASFAAGSEISFSSKNGGTFKPWQFDSSFQAPSVAAGLTASARVSVGPSLSIKLFKFIGPYMGVLGFAELKANALSAPCYSVTTGLDGVLGFNIGVDLPILGEVTIADYSISDTLTEKVVASGTCELPPNASTLPPGDGADAAHLLKPTYTPFSATYSRFLEEFPYLPSSHAWTDVTRSIDGAYVVAGARAQALMKVTEEGGLVWAKQYVDEDKTFHDGLPLRPSRTAPSDDAEMFVTTYPWTVLKVGQAGGVRWAKRLVTGPHDEEDGAANGNAEENNQFGGMLSDGKGGALIIGSDQPAGSIPPVTKGWLTHLSREGELLSSTSYAVEGRQMYPTFTAKADGGVLVGGTLYAVNEHDHAFAMRLGEDGNVVWAQRIQGCGSQPGVGALAATRTREGKYLIVGRHTSYQRSFALLLTGEEGNYLSAANPWAGSDVQYALIRSVVELPTSGFAVAGDYEIAGSLNRRLFTAGLDAIGNPLWSQGYRFPDRDSSFPALVATDQGGLFVAGELVNEDVVGEGYLWAMTPFARDGAQPLGNGAEREDFALVEGDCLPTVEPLVVQTAKLPVTVMDRVVKVADLATQKVSRSP